MQELPLREIHLPYPISWWPLAFGWWLLLGLGIVLLVFLFFAIWSFFKPTLKKEASKALETIEQVYHENGNSVECLIELSSFLRRAMLSRGEKVAGVTGRAWLEVLDQPLGSAEFSQGIGNILLSGPYRHSVDADELLELLDLCRKWVKCL